MIARLHSWWQKIKHPSFIATGIIIVLIALTTLIFAAYRFGWSGTGFLNKTLWDWMQLFLLPVALAAIGIWFNWSQKQHEQEIAERNRESERKIADDRQKDATLETYLGQMANLVLHEGLHMREGAAEASVEVRQVAWAQTLTALQRLDGRRRAIIVRFLYESHLIDKDKPIVDLKGVVLNEAHQWFYALSNRGDLEALGGTGANLEEVDLRGANLARAGLSGVNFRNAILRGAYLWEAELNGANLSGVDLRWANLGGADLRKVILTGVQLDHASLRGSDLREADLRGAVWGEKGADLSYANLVGAKLDDLVLSKARLEQANMEAVTNYDSDLPISWEISHSEVEWGKMDGPMLENACLMSCSLRGVDLQKANLRGADLTDATLEHANLSGADLRGANLDGAELREVDLSEANLEEVFVTDEQLAKAKSTKGIKRSDGKKHL